MGVPAKGAWQNVGRRLPLSSDVKVEFKPQVNEMEKEMGLVKKKLESELLMYQFFGSQRCFMFTSWPASFWMSSCVYINLCPHMCLCVSDCVQKRKRELVRVLLVSFSPNEQTKPFRPTLVCQCSCVGAHHHLPPPFLSLHHLKTPPVAFLFLEKKNPMLWHEWRQERIWKLDTNYWMGSCWEIERLIKTQCVKRLLASYSLCHYSSTTLEPNWELTAGTLKPGCFCILSFTDQWKNLLGGRKNYTPYYHSFFIQFILSVWPHKTWIGFFFGSKEDRP